MDGVYDLISRTNTSVFKEFQLYHWDDEGITPTLVTPFTYICLSIDMNSKTSIHQLQNLPY